MEVYENVDLRGYRKYITKDCSEFILIDNETKCDFFTGEYFEREWGGHDPDFGYNGGWTDIVFFDENTLLIDMAKKHGIECEPFYFEHETDKIYKIFRDCSAKFKFVIKRDGKEVHLPERQYEVSDNGKVKALKKLRYYNVYSNR